ncbi:MAG: glycosyltransferase [Geminocystis sp.]|nr:glycosyltransferase [Geminocystis sp.]MDW8117324.1 glycosyltransferase [Geminocystis sp.]HIK38817.1 glycosyltransferase [Geminocystis sp. M7585_C2015_104]
MKILIVHNKYQSKNIGGEDIVYKNELESLRKKLGEKNVLSYEVSNDDVNQFKLLFEIWFSWEHYKNIRRMVEENRINIVHVHNFFPMLTPSVFKAAKEGGAKVIHTLHNYRLWCISGILYRDGYGTCEVCTKNKFSLAGILNRCYRNSLLQSIAAQLAFWFYKVTGVFDSVDYFFVLTDFQKEKVKSLGISENRIIAKPNSLRIPLELQKQKEKQGYIYVGRLEESKGIYELLKVWSRLDRRFVLTVIGGGKLERELKNKFMGCDNVIFKGVCTREETLENMAKSKYLIQPSLWYETFGLTIIEAMSVGTPVIGFDIGTRKDFIKNGVNGFLCTPSTFEETIRMSLEYPEYDTLSQNAMKTAKLYHDDYIIEQQIEAYKKILEERI